jgi:hypothetical protein
MKFMQMEFFHTYIMYFNQYHQKPKFILGEKDFLIILCVDYVICAYTV